MFSKKFFVLFLFLLLSVQFYATHNRAGEITYKRIQPFTSVLGGITVPVYNYSITVTLYTDFGDDKADRCQDTVYFGDGDKAVIDRINGGPGMRGCNRCSKCGEILVNQADYSVKVSTYTVTHTYPGAGTYLIRTFDRNRNEGVKNIPNSINQPFYVEAFLVITSFTGANSSPLFSFPPIDKACAKDCFYHNPGAYDPDKDDSLSYEITSSRGNGGLPVVGYTMPNAGTSSNYSINPVTGLLSWCTPQEIGEYNIAFIVKEWRKNTSGVYQLIGYVLRDMQVIVEACPTNDPPEIELPKDTCVEAGTLINKYIYVSDPNNGQIVTIEGGGGAFNADFPQATLTNTVAITYTPISTGGYYANFVWQTTCDHVKNIPYYATFKALDDGVPGRVQLANFKTYSIKVFPPSIKNVSATPNGSNMRITWKASSCSPINNALIGYRIYRKNDCIPFISSPCKNDELTANNYTLLAQTNKSVTTWIDDNNGKGLVVGQDYSYIVVGVYADGTETHGDNQICAKLIRDVPVIINVDVLSTSSNNGSILVRWCNPRVKKGDFDTLLVPGPYHYVLKHKKTDGTYETVFTSKKASFFFTDTVFTHTAINTSDLAHEYYVDFFAANNFSVSSQKANSMFLKLSPSDRKVNLIWEVNTPWSNTLYTIYRKDPNTTTYTAIANTSLTTYLDTKNVANRNTYCYKIESKGAFSDPTLPFPLINHSQESCTLVKDLTPPCTPTLSLEADCPGGYVNVKWNYLNSICDSSDDVIKYVLYFKSTTFDEYFKLATLTNNSATNFELNGQEFISGCYAMMAIDSSDNVSRLSPDYCVDNCPEFELPNIFTPNGDGANDFYQAIKVRQIKEIDLSIFDRWGNLVYKTNDPYFKWDGTSKISKRQVSEGTFFYACIVYEPRVTGIVKRTIKGFLQLSK